MNQPMFSTDVTHRWPLHDVENPTGTTQTLGGWVLATWVGVAMVVLVPAALVYFTPAPKSATWLFALVVTTTCGARYMWIVADGRCRLYELTFWVFTYVFLGLAPLAQLRTERTPITTPRVDTTLNQPAMVVIIVGLVAFTIGLSVAAPRLRIPRVPFIADGVSMGRTLVLAVFALTASLYLIVKVGLSVFFSSRYELQDTITLVWANSLFAPLAIPMIAGGALLVAFIALVKCAAQTPSREWPLYLLTIFVGLALAITIFNPITSPRTYFGTAVMALAALIGLFSTPRLFRLTAIVWVIVMIVLFPLADYFRGPDPYFKSNSLVESLITPDFSAMAEINNTLLYVERYGGTHGRQAAGVALFWVPRQLWPDKPVDTTMLVAASRGYSYLNLGAPLWSELYINGGWALLLLGMLALGVTVRSLDNRIEKSLQRARAPSVLGCILPFYFMILLRGSLLQAMGILFVMVASSLFVSRRKRSLF